MYFDQWFDQCIFSTSDLTSVFFDQWFDQLVPGGGHQGGVMGAGSARAVCGVFDQRSGQRFDQRFFRLAV